MNTVPQVWALSEFNLHVWRVNEQQCEDMQTASTVNVNIEYFFNILINGIIQAVLPSSECPVKRMELQLFRSECLDEMLLISLGRLLDLFFFLLPTAYLRSALTHRKHPLQPACRQHQQKQTFISSFAFGFFFVSLFLYGFSLSHIWDATLKTWCFISLYRIENFIYPKHGKFTNIFSIIAEQSIPFKI